MKNHKVGVMILGTWGPSHAAGSKASNISWSLASIAQWQSGGLVN